jgi:multiple sugar transport system substrate-binding protein
MNQHDVTLRIAIRQVGPFDEAIREQWDRFASVSGTTLQLDPVSLDLHDLYQSLVTDDGLRTGVWDVAFLSSDWFADIHDRQAVVDLTPLLSAAPPPDYPDGWPRSLIENQQFGPVTLGLPYHDGPECLIYRTDLFNDEQEQAAYQSQFGEQLAPPRTWEEFARIAEFFHRPEQNLYGTTFAAFPDGHNTVFDFCLQLWSRGGDLFDADGAIRLVSDEAIAALEFYRSVMTNPRAVHPRSATLDSVAAGQVLADGEVAMAINWFGFAAFAASHETSRVRGLIDIAPIPSSLDEGVSLNSYWILAIAAGSPHVRTAYEFLRFCASPEMDRRLTEIGGIGCRTSTWVDPGINKSIPFYHRLESLHAVARTLPRRPDWTQIASAIDSIVLSTINTSEDVEAILRRHADELRARLREG